MSKNRGRFSRGGGAENFFFLRFSSFVARPPQLFLLPRLCFSFAVRHYPAVERADGTRKRELLQRFHRVPLFESPLPVVIDISPRSFTRRFSLPSNLLPFHFFFFFFFLLPIFVPTEREKERERETLKNKRCLVDCL